MKQLIVMIMMGVLTLSLTGCAGDGTIRKQDVGVVTGGVLGGVLGSQIGGGRGRTAAIIGGTLVGALIGGSIGKSMDDVDRMKTQRALENTRTNQTTRWTNPDSGNSYTVTPTRTYTRTVEGSSQPCREYRTTAYVGGKKEEVYGTACRQADGSWKVVQ